MDFYPSIQKHELNIVFRDLSKHEHFNVAKLWEEEKERIKELSRQNNTHDTKVHKKHKSNQNKTKLNKTKQNKSNQNKTNQNKTKGKNLSSKEKLLLKIQKNKEKKEANQDADFIKNSLEIGEINMTELKNKIGLMQTEQGIQDMKMAYLKEAFKRHDIKNTIDLFIELRDKQFDNKKDRKLMEKINKKCMKKLDMSLELYQLFYLGDRLPPLDFYNKQKFQLEKWQKRILSCIEQRRNVFLNSPTSSGKTLIVTSSAQLTDFKYLIILPTEALALQVASTIHKFMKNNRVYGLWTKHYRYNLTAGCDILISTPKIIEQNIHNIPQDFDYLIFDEIHCLNYYEIGPSIERIIHYFPNSNFFAISATISNVDELCEWWKSIRPNTDIHIEIYKNRFINLERHIMVGDKLENLHPLSLITIEDLHNSDNNALWELAFCPKDLAQCWTSIYQTFKNIEDIDEKIPAFSKLKPEVYFKQFDTYRVTLRQTKTYEEELKKLLVKLSQLYEDKTKELLELFNIDTNIKEIEYMNSNRNGTSILDCANAVRKNELMPSLFFPSDYSQTIDYYKKMVFDLEKQLHDEWPFYLEHQNFRKELFDKMVQYEKRLEISRDKEKNNKEKNKKQDKNRDDNLKDEIEEKYKNMLKKEMRKQIGELISFYEEHKMKYTNDPNSNTANPTILKNYEAYYKNIYEWTKIPYVSDYDRPREMCYFRIPLTEEEIDKARMILINETSISVSVKNYLLVGLFYGIGIYLNELPAGYLRFLQTCSQNRKLGILISDKTLSMGISMPFLSVLLYQHGEEEFVQMEAVQMAGRAGRRNRDNTGHLIICNANPKTLLLKEKTRITGSNIKVPTLGILQYLQPKKNVQHLTRKTIYSFCTRKNQSTPNNDDITTTITTELVVYKCPQTYNSECDYYTESRKSWDTGIIRTLSMNEKAVIWESTTCYPYPNQLYSNLGALYFIKLMKNENIYEQLENCQDKQVQFRAVNYILSICYFGFLIEDNFDKLSYKGQSICEQLMNIFIHTKDICAIYGRRQSVPVNDKSKAQETYNTLLKQYSNNTFVSNDPKYIFFLYNMTEFLQVLSKLKVLHNTTIMHSMKRVFMYMRKFILDYCLRNYNETSAP